MLDAIACLALREKRCLTLRYRGIRRIVEVHAVGRSLEGDLVMRVWQVGGGSRSERVGWKLFGLRDVVDAELTGEASRAPRDGFNRNDPAMGGGIICVV